MKLVNWKWIVPAAFLVLTAVFFHRAFLGYSFQGTDTSLGLLKVVAPQVNVTGAAWLDHIWMGYRSPLFSVNPFTLFLKIVPTDMALFFTYFVSILLALTFMYLFLRKLGLTGFSPVFGAVAYAFTPHFITLATAAHVTVIEMVFLPPLVFYFLAAAFDREEKDRLKIVLCLAFAGIGWGQMMAEDPQRGLYFSLAAAAYAVYLIVVKNGIGLKSFLRTAFQKSVLFDGLKLLLTGAFLLLVFYPSLTGWMDTLKIRSAQTQAAPDPKAAEQAKWNQSTSWSHNPLELVDSVAFGYHGNFSGDAKAPYWGGIEYLGSSVALGFFTVLFALIGIFAYIRRKSAVALFFWIGLAALLLSFGRHLPGTPFYWLFYKLPLMGNFRAPVKFMAVTAFCASVLSAFGFSFVFRLMTEDAEKQSRTLSNLLKILSVFGGIALVWLFYILVTSTDFVFSIGQKLNAPNLAQTAVTNTILSLVRMIVFTALSLGILTLFRRFRQKKFVLEGSALAFLLLLVIDLWGINWFYLDKSYFRPADFYREDNVVMFLKGQSRQDIFRVGTALHIPVRGQVQPYPTTSLRGLYLTYMFPYFGLQPMDISAVSGVVEDYNNFFLRTLVGSLTAPLQTAEDVIEINIRLFQLANVRYLVIDIPTTNTNLTLSNIVRGYDGRDHYLYFVKGHLPRVGFYSGYRMVTNNAIDGLTFIGDPAVSVQKEAVVVGPSNAVVPSLGAVAAQKILAYAPDRVLAEVVAPVDGLVLFTTKHDPDWKAFLNGRRVPVRLANYAQMGVIVPAGKHQLEFKFSPDPAPFIVSLGTVLAGLAAAVVYAAMKLIRRKNPPVS